MTDAVQPAPAPAPGVDVWESESWIWTWILPAALGLCSVGVVGSDFSATRRSLGLGLAVLLSVVHVTLGRAVMRRDRHVECVVYLFSVLTAASVLFTIHPVFFFGLFGLYPLCFVVIDNERVERVALLFLSTTTMVALAGWNDWTRSAWALAVSQAVVSLLFAFGMGTWISRIIEQSKARRGLIEELEVTRKALAVANHQSGIAQERERLAGEIHDTLAQGFTSLLMLVQGADAALDTDPARARSLLESAASTARENLAEARSLVAALQPIALQSSSLADAIRRLGERFEAETGIATTVDVLGTSRVLPSSDDVVLLRSAQESLANVRRHARATKVHVVLDFGGGGSGERARLVVTDDGRGFVVPADSVTSAAPVGDGASGGGFGLAGMRKRAVQAGGWVAVRSELGEGTSVEVVLP